MRSTDVNYVAEQIKDIIKHETILIAEISSNHNGSLARALDLIAMCGEIGFDAVKFQLFKIEKLFSKEILITVKHTGIEESGSYQRTSYQSFQQK